MSTDGNQSRFTLKAMAYSGGGFFIAWAATKLLDTYFDLSLLKGAQSFFVDIWHWLLQDEPLPHWFLISAIVAFTILIGVVSKLKEKVAATEFSEELVKTVETVLNPPKVQKPTKVQHKILMKMGVHTDYKIPFDPDLLARDCKLTALEFEVAFGQLLSTGMIQWAPRRPGRKQLPLLSQKGKEYILQARSDVQELL